MGLSNKGMPVRPLQPEPASQGLRRIANPNLPKDWMGRHGSRWTAKSRLQEEVRRVRKTASRAQ